LDLPSFPTRRSSDLHAHGSAQAGPLAASGTLARVRHEQVDVVVIALDQKPGVPADAVAHGDEGRRRHADRVGLGVRSDGSDEVRSEEHTSELQSPYD